MAKKKHYHQWERVHGPDLDAGKKGRAALNLSVFKSSVFLDACLACGVDATPRQARKFRMRRGLAWSTGHKG